MNRVARLPAAARRELFEETGARRGMSPAIAEKDFWVCWVLKQLFEDGVLRERIVFKGGTTLSKVHKLIDRMSEDIVPIPAKPITDSCRKPISDSYASDQPLGAKRRWQRNDALSDRLRQEKLSLGAAGVARRLSLTGREYRRRSGGNVGIAAFAISKGGGKRGKPGLGFPLFPPPVISTARYGSALARFTGGFFRSDSPFSSIRCAA